MVQRNPYSKFHYNSASLFATSSLYTIAQPQLSRFPLAMSRPISVYTLLESDYPTYKHRNYPLSTLSYLNTCAGILPTNSINKHTHTQSHTQSKRPWTWQQVAEVARTMRGPPEIGSLAIRQKRCLPKYKKPVTKSFFDVTNYCRVPRSNRSLQTHLFVASSSDPDHHTISSRPLYI